MSPTATSTRYSFLGSRALISSHSPSTKVVADCQVLEPMASQDIQPVEGWVELTACVETFPPPCTYLLCHSNSDAVMLAKFGSRR